MPSIPSRSFLVLALIALTLSVVGVGCDKGGIYPLAQQRDVVETNDGPTSTWLRSTAEGTEILLIGLPAGAAVPGAPTEPAQDVPPLILARGFIAHDSSTTLDNGTYVLDATGNGTFEFGNHYYFDYQPEVKLVSRTGTRRTPIDPPTQETLAIAMAGSLLRVTFNGEAHDYTSFSDVVAKIDPDTAAGATAAFRVYNLPLFISQNRLLGFGCATMATYIGDGATNFNGLLAGKFNVSVESYLNPNTDIVYTAFQDLTGIQIDGKQRTEVDVFGDGKMKGALAWQIFEGDGTAPNPKVVMSGTVDYANLRIGNGVASGGSYSIHIDGGGTFDMPYTLASNVDLRDVLPVVSP